MKATVLKLLVLDQLLRNLSKRFKIKMYVMLGWFMEWCVCESYCLWALWAAPVKWWRRCMSWRPSQSDQASENSGVCSTSLSAMTNGVEMRKSITINSTFTSSWSRTPLHQLNHNSATRWQCGIVPQQCSKHTWYTITNKTHKIPALHSLSSSSIRARRSKKITALFLLWHFLQVL